MRTTWWAGLGIVLVSSTWGGCGGDDFTAAMPESGGAGHGVDASAQGGGGSAGSTTGGAAGLAGNGAAAGTGGAAGSSEQGGSAGTSGDSGAGGFGGAAGQSLGGAAGQSVGGAAGQSVGGAAGQSLGGAAGNGGLAGSGGVAGSSGAGGYGGIGGYGGTGGYGGIGGYGGTGGYVGTGGYGAGGSGGVTGSGGGGGSAAGGKGGSGGFAGGGGTCGGYCANQTNVAFCSDFDAPNLQAPYGWDQTVVKSGSTSTSSLQWQSCYRSWFTTLSGTTSSTDTNFALIAKALPSTVDVVTMSWSMYLESVPTCPGTISYGGFVLGTVRASVARTNGALVLDVLTTNTGAHTSYPVPGSLTASQWHRISLSVTLGAALDGSVTVGVDTSSKTISGIKTISTPGAPIAAQLGLYLFNVCSSTYAYYDDVRINLE